MFCLLFTYVICGLFPRWIYKVSSKEFSKFLRNKFFSSLFLFYTHWHWHYNKTITTAVMVRVKLRGDVLFCFEFSPVASLYFFLNYTCATKKSQTHICSSSLLNYLEVKECCISVRLKSEAFFVALTFTAE